MSASTQIDWNKYAQPEPVPQIDFSKYEQGGTNTQTSAATSSSTEGGVAGMLGSLWHQTFLGQLGDAAQEVSDWASKKASKNREENLSAVAGGHEQPHSESFNTVLDMLSSYGKLEKASTEPKNLALAGVLAAANTNPVTGTLADTALMAHGAYGVATNAKEALKGNPEAAESALLSGAEAVGGAAGAGSNIKEVPGAIRSGWRTIGNPLGLASTGEELLTQGISPRASLSQFKPSLEKAAGDLKAYDANSRINSVQDLNDAIPEIKQKIWSEEIEPALKRQATKPVDMQPVADAVRAQISDEMKTFDEANADKLETLASKLENAKDVTSANALLKYANGQLESYFQKFPAARRANLMNNPETAGWEAARSELRNQFLTTLENEGENGVRDARLRYGALDTLQDAVERRVNVADRAKPVSLGRLLGFLGAPFTSGASLALGEASNYLNKPDVLVRRGIRNLPSKEITIAPEESNVSPITGAVMATPSQLFKKAANE